MMADQNGEMKPPSAKGPTTPVALAGSSVAVSARLPSFRGPRDLTLSSTSTKLVKPSLMTRTRKTFAPNIPVRREKVENSLETHSDKPTKRRDRDKNFKKEGGRGRGRAKEYVQTTGSLFGEGIASPSLRRGMSGGFGGYGGGGGGGAGKTEAGYIHKPVLNLETMNNIDKEHEDQKLKEILRDDFIDDLDDVIGRTGDDDLFPVQLPLVDTGRGFKEEDTKDVKDVKPIVPSHMGIEGVEVKTEPADPSDEKDSASAFAPETKNVKNSDRKFMMKGGLPAQEKAPELSVTQLLCGKHEDVMFFQLPSSLPSHPPSIKQEPMINTQQQPQQQQQQKAFNNIETEDDDEEEEEKKVNPCCTLNTLPEGQIGTLKIFKSGKVELWLGNHKLAVNKGTQVGFLQDVVSVDVDQETKTGSMTVLGHVGHRLVCTPDMEALVRQMKT